MEIVSSRVQSSVVIYSAPSRQIVQQIPNHELVGCVGKSVVTEVVRRSIAGQIVLTPLALLFGVICRVTLRASLFQAFS